jgi:hypothetical protein
MKAKKNQFFNSEIILSCFFQIDYRSFGLFTHGFGKLTTQRRLKKHHAQAITTKCQRNRVIMNKGRLAKK